MFAFLGATMIDDASPTGERGDIPAGVRAGAREVREDYPGNYLRWGNVFLPV